MGFCLGGHSPATAFSVSAKPPSPPRRRRQRPADRPARLRALRPHRASATLLALMLWGGEKRDIRPFEDVQNVGCPPSRGGAPPPGRVARLSANPPVQSSSMPRNSGR